MTIPYPCAPLGRTESVRSLLISKAGKFLRKFRWGQDCLFAIILPDSSTLFANRSEGEGYSREDIILYRKIETTDCTDNTAFTSWVSQRFDRSGPFYP